MLGTLGRKDTHIHIYSRKRGENGPEDDSGLLLLRGKKKSHEGIKYKKPGDSVLNKTFLLH